MKPYLRPADNYFAQMSLWLVFAWFFGMSLIRLGSSSLLISSFLLFFTFARPSRAVVLLRGARF